MPWIDAPNLGLVGGGKGSPEIRVALQVQLEIRGEFCSSALCLSQSRCDQLPVLGVVDPQLDSTVA